MPQTFSGIADEIHRLNSASKQELMVLIRPWSIEARREEIAQNAELSEVELSNGDTKSGNVDELLADLNSCKM